MVNVPRSWEVAQAPLFPKPKICLGFILGSRLGTPYMYIYTYITIYVYVYIHITYSFRVLKITIVK